MKALHSAAGASGTSWLWIELTHGFRSTYIISQERLELRATGEEHARHAATPPSPCRVAWGGSPRPFTVADLPCSATARRAAVGPDPDTNRGSARTFWSGCEFGARNLHLSRRRQIPGLEGWRLAWLCSLHRSRFNGKETGGRFAASALPHRCDSAREAANGECDSQMLKRMPDCEARAHAHFVGDRSD